jgi:hypothetical protein
MSRTALHTRIREWEPFDRSTDRTIESAPSGAPLHHDVRLGYMFIPNTTGANEFQLLVKGGV